MARSAALSPQIRHRNVGFLPEQPYEDRCCPMERACPQIGTNKNHPAELLLLRRVERPHSENPVSCGRGLLAAPLSRGSYLVEGVSALGTAVRKGLHRRDAEGAQRGTAIIDGTNGMMRMWKSI